MNLNLLVPRICTNTSTRTSATSPIREARCVADRTTIQRATSDQGRSALTNVVASIHVVGVEMFDTKMPLCVRGRSACVDDKLDKSYCKLKPLRGNMFFEPMNDRI
mmetsp:Transcript_515/g.1458  ORF Transcript_515/g.1458 Transcript_515/m.1458 type:complete len:106 (-) Transcript_515:155-472(-)